MFLAMFPFGSEYGWFWNMCEAVAVSVTLMFIVRQLRMQGEMHRTVLKQTGLQNAAHLVNSFAVFENRWNSTMMLEARREVCRRTNGATDVVDPAMHYVCLFFEELGVHCAKRTLDEEIAWEIYSFEIENYWAISRNAIMSFRKKKSDNTFYNNFEALHNAIRKIGTEKGAPSGDQTRKDIDEFIKHELDRVEFFVGRTKRAEASAFPGRII